jgi:hypothetical protein
LNVACLSFHATRSFPRRWLTVRRFCIGWFWTFQFQNFTESNQGTSTWLPTLEKLKLNQLMLISSVRLWPGYGLIWSKSGAICSLPILK